MLDPCLSAPQLFWEWQELLPPNSHQVSDLSCALTFLHHGREEGVEFASVLLRDVTLRLDEALPDSLLPVARWREHVAAERYLRGHHPP